ncbi:MAG: FAD-dependent oxidoreductase [Candidatus Scalinduaceae bacterium]
MATVTVEEKRLQLGVMNFKSLVRNIKCQYRCPVHMDIPEYIRLIAQGKHDESYNLMRETNPLPSVCGRVCYHPCENECKRNKTGESVAINNLKRFVTDYVQSHRGGPPQLKVKLREERVAIIGSGPAGLTAAHDLAKLGYRVTVFEREPVVGGMLRLCIPAFRLPREQIKYDLQYILKLGVEFRLNTNVGKDLTIDDLLNKGYKAVFIATGAHRSNTLNIPGEDAKGVVNCIEFLKKVNLKGAIEIGAKVVVIGGGSSAIDSARSVLRLGSEVTIIYRRTRKEMPAYHSEIKEAEEEGVKIKCLAAPIEIVSDNEMVTAVKCVEMAPGEIDESGRPRPVPISGKQFIVETDYVIHAIGQIPDLEVLSGNSDINASKRGTIEVEDCILRTNRPNVFAGGDVVTGNGMIIDAIAQGHAASKSINGYISERDSVVEKEEILVSLEDSEFTQRENNYDTIERQKPEILPVEKRSKKFIEVFKCMTEEQAKTEAQRCLQCDKNIEIETRDCVLCGRCASVCPMNAIRILTVNGKETHFRTFMNKDGAVRYKDREACIKCGICADCPTDSISVKKVVWR